MTGRASQLGEALQKSRELVQRRQLGLDRGAYGGAKPVSVGNKVLEIRQLVVRFQPTVIRGRSCKKIDDVMTSVLDFDDAMTSVLVFFDDPEAPFFDPVNPRLQRHLVSYGQVGETFEQALRGTSPPFRWQPQERLDVVLGTHHTLHVSTAEHGRTSVISGT